MLGRELFGDVSICIALEHWTHAAADGGQLALDSVRDVLRTEVTDKYGRRSHESQHDILLHLDIVGYLMV